MLVQGMWDKDPAVMQLPHVTREIGERCVAAGVEEMCDLIDMEDDARRELLELSDGQLEDVAEAANGIRASRSRSTSSIPRTSPRAMRWR